ncbi:MAG: DUF2127 domain-containing protein [Patescibacteria group bacterium]
MKIKKENLIHDAFDIGISIKGIDGVLEIIGGIILLFASPIRVNKIIDILTRHELSQDPNDIIAHYLTNFAHNFSASAQLFGSFFLLSHGIIKVFLVVSLWKGKHWAYPLAVSIFSLFTVYQMYRYFLKPSPLLIILSVLDIFVIVLTWLEYKRVKSEITKSIDK